MEYIISKEYDGKQRKLYKKLCSSYNNLFYVPKHILEKSKYCSRQCSDKCREHKNNKKLLVCAKCFQEFKVCPSKLKNSKSGFHFCSRKCKDEAQRLEGIKEIHPSHYRNGDFAYRRYAFRIKGKFCNKCGYDKCEQMLDVHHIDSNRSNNKIENLEVLCVWCHAFETRKINPHNWMGNIIKND